MKMATAFARPVAAALVLVATTAFGVSTGVLTGAALGPILIVGLAFGSCFAAGALLLMLARPQVRSG